VTTAAASAHAAARPCRMRAACVRVCVRMCVNVCRERRSELLASSVSGGKM
jgi:hypothetical protein